MSLFDRPASDYMKPGDQEKIRKMLPAEKDAALKSFFDELEIVIDKNENKRIGEK